MPGSLTHQRDCVKFCPCVQSLEADFPFINFDGRRNAAFHPDAARRSATVEQRTRSGESQYLLPGTSPRATDVNSRLPHLINLEVLPWVDLTT